MKGIDVSKHNGNINWKNVKASGKVDFVILRAGYGKSVTQKDPKFDSYYLGAKSEDIPVGAYWYSYATTVAEAKQEAEVCIQCLRGKQFEYPIYFDLEEQKAFATGKKNCSAMVRAFCDALEAAGYWVGLYISRSPLQTYIEDDIKTRYALWVAEYASKLNYSGEVGMWQYSSKGSISGIPGSVDLDECYCDYPSAIKAGGKNNFSIPSTPAQPATPTPTTEPEKPTVTKEQKRFTITFDGKTYSGILTEV